jgi:ABC-type Fe3+/spermidine/putrescine transport system ATPase subunit
MSRGRITQLGTPQDVYEEPVNAYVADFLGVSNLLDAVVTHAGGPAQACTLRLGDFRLEAACGAVSATGPVKLAIRPERVQLGAHGTSGPNRLPALVERTVFLGSATQVHVRLATGEQLQALVHNDGQPVVWPQGTAVSVGLEAAALRVLPVDDTPAPADPEPAASLAVDGAEGAASARI